MKSAWERYAGSRPSYQALEESTTTDLVIVGAGFTGLSTALHAARAGMSVMVLEAATVGSMASGRNGGQVVPGLKALPSDVERRYGHDAARRLQMFGSECAAYTFKLIADENIDCDPTFNGWIYASFSAESDRRVQAQTQELTSAGADVCYLSAAEMKTFTGSEYFSGGMIERGAGAVHPLKLARGLSASATRYGAALYEHSRVNAIERRGNYWTLQCNQIEVRARTIVVATDAYTGALLPALERSMISVASAQIATAPLPADLLSVILPRRAGISDARKLTHYCRIDPNGRFFIGGRCESGSHISQATVARLKKAAIARFPGLKDVEWPYAWAGHVGLTPDDLPHLSTPMQNLWTAYGYGGRGVALAIRMGKTLASAASEGSAGDLDYPVTPLRPLPFHSLRRPAALTAIGWYIAREAVGYPG